MTLCTRVLVLDPTPAQAVHAKATELANPDGHEVQFTLEEATEPWADGRSTFYNGAGQGLTALIWTHFGTDHPISDREEPGDEGPDFMAVVAFDSPYSCCAHHAWLVTQLGEWLDDRGVRWLWQNEYDGSLHKGLDDIALLGDPLNANPRSR